MTQSKSIKVTSKCFYLDDAVRLVAIVVQALRHAHPASEFSTRPRMVVTLTVEGGSTFTSEDDLSVLDPGSEALLYRPLRLEATLTDYAGGIQLKVDLAHARDDLSVITMHGPPSWVRDVSARVAASLEATPPADPMTRLRGWMGIIGAYGTGSLLSLLFTAVGALLPAMHVPPGALEGQQSSWFWIVMHWMPGYLMITTVYRLVLGTVFWPTIGPWFWEAFPSVELHFGPTHLNTAAVRPPTDEIPLLRRHLAHRARLGLRRVAATLIAAADTRRPLRSAVIRRDQSD